MTSFDAIITTSDIAVPDRGTAIEPTNTFYYGPGQEGLPTQLFVRDLVNPFPDLAARAILAERILREEAEKTTRIHSMAAQIYHERDGIDGLTQLIGKTKFKEKLKEQIARTRRDGTTFGLVFYDIDDFTSFNNTYGHEEAGDPVLKGVADASVDCLRDVDVVGRYGGEEFVAIVYDLQPGDGTSSASRLVDAIRNLRVESSTGNELPQVTVSVGFAEYQDEPAETLDEACSKLVRTADGAMYAAKNAGKDRVYRAITDPETNETTYEEMVGPQED